MQTNPPTESAARGRSALSWNVGLFLLGLLAAGCPAGKTPPEGTSGAKVLIRGSNTFGEELAPRLIAEYKKDHATAAFEVESKATVYGIAALLGGKCDIAGASDRRRAGFSFKTSAAESRREDSGQGLARRLT